jgi:hypothetical protein
MKCHFAKMIYIVTDTSAKFEKNPKKLTYMETALE